MSVRLTKVFGLVPGLFLPMTSRLVLLLPCVFSCLPSSAETIPNSGGVYYEYGAGGLEQMTLWIVTLFTYVTDLMFANGKKGQFY